MGKGNTDWFWEAGNVLLFDLPVVTLCWVYLTYYAILKFHNFSCIHAVFDTQKKVIQISSKREKTKIHHEIRTILVNFFSTHNSKDVFLGIIFSLIIVYTKMEFSVSQCWQLASIINVCLSHINLYFFNTGNHNILPGPLKASLLTDLEMLNFYC